VLVPSQSAAAVTHFDFDAHHHWPDEQTCEVVTDGQVVVLDDAHISYDFPLESVQLIFVMPAPQTIGHIVPVWQ